MKSGNNQPAAVVELKSIGFANKEKVVDDITKYLDQTYKIPRSRIGMTLVDLVILLTIIYYFNLLKFVNFFFLSILQMLQLMVN